MRRLSRDNKKAAGVKPLVKLQKKKKEKKENAFRFRCKCLYFRHLTGSFRNAQCVWHNHLKFRAEEQEEEHCTHTMANNLVYLYRGKLKEIKSRQRWWVGERRPWPFTSSARNLLFKMGKFSKHALVICRTVVKKKIRFCTPAWINVHEKLICLWGIFCWWFNILVKFKNNLLYIYLLAYTVQGSR